MELAEAFKRLGFTGQEAKILLFLYGHGPSTGYEVAKRTKLSRSNVYASLESLVEKGGVNKMDDGSKKFAPLDKDEFLHNVKNGLSLAFKAVETGLPSFVAEEKNHVTVVGPEPVRNKISWIIARTEHRIYMSMPEALYNIFALDMRQLLQKGLKAVLFSDRNPLQDRIKFYEKDLEPGQVNIISDTAKVLSGVLVPGSYGHCLYSENENLVRLMRTNFLNEITLAEKGLQ